MHFSQLVSTLLLGSSVAGVYGFVMPDPMIEGKKAAHSYHLLDLDTSEMKVLGNATDEADSLEKRTKVKTCMKALTSPRAGTCYAGAGALFTAAILISNQLKKDSNTNDCSIHYGSADGISWKVSASGRNCDTTAQQNTIQGSLDEYIESVGEKLCGVTCLELTHGGTWHGYVTIAPPGEDPANYYCGSSQQFGSCVSGGKAVSSSDPGYIAVRAY